MKEDDTVRLPHAAPPRAAAAAGTRSRRPRALLPALAAGLVLAALLLAGARYWPGKTQNTATPADTPADTAAGAIAALPLADEATLDAETPETLTVHRFAQNPRILVLDFPSLHQQALMFNRLAVFAERAGAPHDRVLDDAALARQISAGGDSADTYYYGHDYDSPTLARFFRLADAGHIALNEQEQRLRAIADAQGMLNDQAGQAVITVPRLGADRQVDDTFRRAILRHELSHGEFFTNPAYAAYATRFFNTTLTSFERAAFVHFLGAQGYDTALPILMINETQAYLVFTPDARDFNAAAVGLSQAEISRLRASYAAGMPAGWLQGDAARE